MRAVRIIVLMGGIGWLGCGGSGGQEGQFDESQSAVTTNGTGFGRWQDWCDRLEDGQYCLDSKRIRGCYKKDVTQTITCDCSCVPRQPGHDDYCSVDCYH